MRSEAGSRSKPPPRTSARIDRCVSAGMPTSHWLIQRSRRGLVGMSHGWTKTGTFVSAQCCRKVMTPSASRSASPTWLPISTPAWPFSMQRSSSRQAASASCRGTWQNGMRRSGACGRDVEGEVVEDRGHGRRLLGGAAVGEEHRGRRDHLQVDAVVVHVDDALVGVPAGVGDAAELPVAEHDRRLGDRVDAQRRPVVPAAGLGEVRPALGDVVGVDVDDRRVTRQHVSPCRGGRRRTGRTCAPARRRRTPRTPVAGR